MQKIARTRVVAILMMEPTLVIKSLKALIMTIMYEITIK